MTNLTLDQKINRLQPGQSIEISRYSNTSVTAERTANGKQIKFIRHTPSGWRVFKTASF